MNVAVYIIECLIMCLAFTILTQGMLFLNPVSFISDYPPEIQEEYYRSQKKERIKEKLNKIMLVKKVIAMIFFVVLFAWMAHMAGAETFVQGILYSYGYVIVLSVFDVVILDWILFANIKRIRLPGTEHMDREYHQKWFHVKVMVPMIPVFLLAGIVIAWIMMLLW